MSEYKELVIKNNGPSFPVDRNDVAVFASERDLRVDIKYLENLLDSHAGCRLSEIDFGGGKRQVDTGNNLIRRYSNDWRKEDYRRLIDELFGEVTSPIAMFYNDIIDMSRSILKMYQLSYYHYVLGKHFKMRCSSFPHNCCGISALNLMLALWESGIVAATKVCTNRYDHAYVIVPFVLRSQSRKGIVLIDPTSDQLIKDQEKKIRNLIRVEANESWSYITDWRGGGDLFPEEIEISACHGRKKVGYLQYIKMALENPVIVA